MEHLMVLHQHLLLTVFLELIQFRYITHGQMVKRPRQLLDLQLVLIIVLLQIL